MDDSEACALRELRDIVEMPTDLSIESRDP